MTVAETSRKTTARTNCSCFRSNLDNLVFRLEVEEFGKGADDARHLFHSGREVVVRARLEVIRDDFVDEGQQVCQLHCGAVLAKHTDQRLDEPRPVNVVTPREVTCIRYTQN